MNGIDKAAFAGSAPLDGGKAIDAVASGGGAVEPEPEQHDHDAARKAQSRKFASFGLGALAMEIKVRDYAPEIQDPSTTSPDRSHESVDLPDRGADHDPVQGTLERVVDDDRVYASGAPETFAAASTSARSDFATERKKKKGFPRVFTDQARGRWPSAGRPEDRDLGAWADGAKRWLALFDGPKLDGVLLKEAKELNAFLKQKLKPAQYKKVVLQLPQRYVDALYGATPLTVRRLGSLNDPAPLLDSTLKRLQVRKGELLRTALEDAKERTPLHEVSRILKARELAKTSDFKDKVDPAKLKALDKRLNELLQDTSLQQQLALIQKQATQEVFADLDPALASMTPKQAVAELAKQQASYLKSPGFRAHIKDLRKHRGAQVADEYVKKELGKLVGLDPQRGAAAAQEIAAREIVDKADDFLKAASPAEIEEPLSAILTERLGDAKKATGIAKTLAGVISKFGTDKDAAVKALESMGGEGAEALAFVKTIPTEFFSHIAKATSLALVAAKGKPTSAGDWLTIAKESLSIAKSIVTAGAISPSALKTILSDGDELLKLSKSINLAGRLLGAAAGAISSAMTLYAAGEDFADGDMVGGAMKTIGGLAAMGGTVMALAGVSGPAAPIVLLVGLTATALDGLFGESDNETLMRQMGILKSS